MDGILNRKSHHRWSSWELAKRPHGVTLPWSTPQSTRMPSDLLTQKYILHAAFDTNRAQLDVWGLTLWPKNSGWLTLWPKLWSFLCIWWGETNRDEASIFFGPFHIAACPGYQLTARSLHIMTYSACSVVGAIPSGKNARKIKQWLLLFLGRTVLASVAASLPHPFHFFSNFHLKTMGIQNVVAGLNKFQALRDPTPGLGFRYIHLGGGGDNQPGIFS